MNSQNENLSPTRDDRPQYYMRLGEVMRAWADLEGSFMGIAADLLNVDQFRARIVLASIGSGRQQREFLTRLAETYMDETLLPRFRSLMNRTKKFSVERNLLAHAQMHINIHNEDCMAFRDTFSGEKYNKSLAFETTNISLSRLTTLRNSIDRLRHDTVTFSFDLAGRVHASAKIHREQ